MENIKFIISNIVMTLLLFVVLATIIYVISLGLSFISITYLESILITCTTVILGTIFNLTLIAVVQQINKK